MARSVRPLDSSLFPYMIAVPAVTTIFDHSYSRVLLPAPFILGSTIKERQMAGIMKSPFSAAARLTCSRRLLYVGPDREYGERYEQ
jgi:hypothetical protein